MLLLLDANEISKSENNLTEKKRKKIRNCIRS